MSRLVFVRLSRILVLAAAVMAGAGCSSFGTYKMEINQGNYLTQAEIERLKTGMTKQQVRLVLGTPTVADAFHSQRWDYPYLRRTDGKLVEEHRLVVYFADDKLMRWEGSEHPVAPIPPERTALIKTGEEEPKTWWGKLLRAIGF